MKLLTKTVLNESSYIGVYCETSTQHFPEDPKYGSMNLHKLHPKRDLTWRVVNYPGSETESM